MKQKHSSTSSSDVVKAGGAGGRRALLPEREVSSQPLTPLRRHRRQNRENRRTEKPCEAEIFRLVGTGSICYHRTSIPPYRPAREEPQSTHYHKDGGIGDLG